jgi:diadenosine tetraphosphatase ApaH/serine/threonine PP2A family protein phosphatase
MSDGHSGFLCHRAPTWRNHPPTVPKIALLSDIHANLPALQAVIEDADRLGIRDFVFMGDIVGYGPHPAECVEMVRQSGAPCVQGNHDYYTVAGSRHRGFIPNDAESRANPVWAGIHHAMRELDGDDIEWLGALPRVIDIPGAIVAHASLDDPSRWKYLLDSNDAATTLDVLERLGLSIGFFGHTHRQEWFSRPQAPGEPCGEDGFVLAPDKRFAVVVGSVGQPRSKDNRASWTVWDSERRIFEFRRTSYPVEQTVAAIRKAGLPAHSARRLM